MCSAEGPTSARKENMRRMLSVLLLLVLAACLVEAQTSRSADSYFRRAKLRRFSMRSLLVSAIFLLAFSASGARAQTSRTAMSYLDRGNRFYAGGDLDRAIGDYDTAITLEPGWALAYYDRGVARYAKGYLDGAIADF